MQVGDKVQVKKEWRAQIGDWVGVLIRMRPFDGKPAWDCKMINGITRYATEESIEPYVEELSVFCECKLDVLMSSGCKCGGK